MKSLRLTLPLAVAAALMASTAVLASGSGANASKSVPVQMRFARELTANEDWDEATRRWVKILHEFGPSDQEAQAEFQLGAVALRRGRADIAASRWERTVQRYPESEWADRAREGLKLLGRKPAPAPEEIQPYVTADTPHDERQFRVSVGDLASGLTVFAIRDFLKVPNLYPDSPRAAEARFRIGTCQAMLGHPERAIAQWRRVSADYPDSPWAKQAQGGIAAWEAILRTAGFYGLLEPVSPLDEDWRPFRSWSTGPDQGLSYAEDLYENGIYTYALQEYAKVLCDLYTPKGGENPHRAYARYRMGVCSYRLGHPDAAARQWRRLLLDYPDSPWAAKASRALAELAAAGELSSQGGVPAPPLPDKLPSGVVKRFNVANQLVDCGLPLVASKEYMKVMYVLTAGKPNPFQAEASYRLGECQRLRGRPELAVKVWENTEKQYPGTPWAEKARSAIEQIKAWEKTLTASHPAAGE